MHTEPSAFLTPADAEPATPSRGREAAPGRSLASTIYDSIRDVPGEQWDRLVRGRSQTYSRQFWEAIERSGLNDFRYRHALFHDEHGAAVALASFYTITTDIAIFAPNSLKALLGAIRRVLPGFLKVRMLECGTPVTLNPPFVAADGVDRAQFTAALHRVLFDLARRERHFLVVVRDFEPPDDDLVPTFRGLGYHLVPSLPTTYLDIAWSSPEEYLDSMKSYYRSKTLKHLRRNREAGVTHELRTGFHDLAEILCRQWNVVHADANEYQREMLTADFYREISLRMGPQAMVLLLRRGGEIIGHTLLLQDGATLRWLYFGRNRSANDSLYIYAGYQVIAAAIELGMRRVELGLTTYATKKDLGAYMSPIRLALRAPRRIINPFVGIVYPWLNRVPAIRNKSIFKGGGAALSARR